MNHPFDDSSSKEWAETKTNGVGTSRGALGGGTRRRKEVEAKRTPVLATGLKQVKIFRYLNAIEGCRK